MKKLYYTFVSFVLFLPVVAHAETVTLTDPLGETDPRQIIANVINAALSVSGSIALLMFVYGGILWLTSFGEPARVDKGKKVLVWTTLGIVLIGSAYVVVQAIFLGITTGATSGSPTP